MLSYFQQQWFVHGWGSHTYRIGKQPNPFLQTCRLVQNSISRRLSHETAAVYTKQCMTQRFFTAMKAFVMTQSRTVTLFWTPFYNLCACKIVSGVSCSSSVECHANSLNSLLWTVNKVFSALIFHIIWRLFFTAARWDACLFTFVRGWGLWFLSPKVCDVSGGSCALGERSLLFQI